MTRTGPPTETATPTRRPAGTNAPMATGDHALAVLLLVQAGLVATTAVLGPLVLDVLHYRTSASGLDQIRGTDITALAIVAPLCVWIGRQAWLGHPAAPALALAPAGFTVYIWTQLLLGNEFGRLPGNVEWFFPLLAGAVGVGISVAVRAARTLRSQAVPRWSRGRERSTGSLLLVVAAFVVLGIHLSGLVDALRDHPVGEALLTTPNAFWVVKAMDLAVVAPAAVLLGTGLLRGRPWARQPTFAVLGSYALLGCSVAAMAWSMLIGGTTGASLGLALGSTAMAAALTGYAAVLYRPLFRATRGTLARGPVGTASGRRP
ncbi:MAG: hypothetical protein QOJ68_1635 [Blastococcus sp.]|nr:hypothetical protein [Blastococcus sp.]